MPIAISLSTCFFTFSIVESNKGTLPKLLLISSTPALVSIRLGCSFAIDAKLKLASTIVTTAIEVFLHNL